MVALRGGAVSYERGTSERRILDFGPFSFGFPLEASTGSILNVAFCVLPLVGLMADP